MYHVIRKTVQGRVVHFLCQNFPGTTNRRQRTFHFMGQQGHVIFQLRPRLQATTHGGDSIRKVANFIVATKARRRRAFIVGHRLGIAPQPIHPATEPPGQQHTRQQTDQ